MKLYRHTTDLAPELRGCAVALGNFDGVHRGHRAVIAATQEKAAALGGATVVLTFEPHPRSLFRPGDPPFRLTPFRIKARLIEALGVDALFVIHFDEAFSRRTAEEFVEHVLIQELGAAHVVAGYDFVFGHKRGGDMALLRRMGEERGFGVTEVRPVADAGGTVFSSTRVRELLQAGEPQAASGILGHPFELEGRVEHGDKRGRTIGFPTANVELGEYLRPRFGVYAVLAGIDQGGGTVWHKGVANLGRRPTVGGHVERLEVHLFDFDGDLYGRHLRVQLLHFLRPELKFDGLDALKAQIAADALAARGLLAAEG
ncbi:bifunctional riboflavin kinase/FAD synthetase [Rhodospirillum centenum]|uniref:Riboflavin biosynthesis protein n=1 Tax=Rhodospirillum centenum (strain ATCC 51521 / SW) TaxID=414684 RepID=B6IXA9_RHOCS|nr:bifunctional riboflavin kinase/FAD synthetase [Rhodospirillum centenum]ACJ00933.1 riboflavin biosynthesis protein RibF [Rhodospirillum centenum SW]